MINPADLAGAREGIRQYIAAGANHVLLNLRAPYPEGIVTRMVSEIVRPLTGAA